MIDLTTDFGKHVAERLRTEHVIWLTTVSAEGAPQPNPVWFLWDGETFLFYSQPTALKLRNIARNPRVALNLNATADGGDVAVFSGEAHLDPATPLADQMPAYLEKYRKGIGDIGQTPESFAKDYSVAYRVRPTRMHGF